MSTEKYKVFNDGGLQALVNQTKANKIAAGDNSAAIDGISTDLQQLGTQVAGVLGEVENCLNELDTVKADTEAVEKALSGKSDTGHTHTKSQISDFPTSMPASDVPAWAKASTKPSYAWSEITGKPSTFAPATHTHNYAGSSSAGGAANSANKLANARTISLTGDVTGSGSFDGSANLSIAATLGDIDCGTF